MPRAMELDINEHRGERTPLDMLLKDIALGSRQAFEKLYRDSSPRLFAICLRIVSHRSEAEDVLQEVLCDGVAQGRAIRRRAGGRHVVAGDDCPQQGDRPHPESAAGS